MSEEKLYAVKNDEGKYLTIEHRVPWWDSQVGTAVRSSAIALAWTEKYGGHVVTLIEEPKKVVLTEEQAEIVEGANESQFPADYITQHTPSSDDEKLIMEAYVNGYTVEKEKEKKYLVYKVLGGKQSERNEKKFAQAYRSSAFPGTMYWAFVNEIENASGAMLTQDEIEHYGLQDCEKEEVTDDEND